MTAAKNYLILPAAGVGSRMKADRPKQYLELHGKTILEHTLDAMLNYGMASGDKAGEPTDKAFEKIVLVVTKGDPYWQDISTLEKYADNPRLMIADGGEERCHSVLNGLQALKNIAAQNDWVAVHDIARPCIRHSDLDLLFSDLTEDGAILAAPVRDTMKRGFSIGSNSYNSGNQISETVERNQLWHALTPQVFPYSALIQALEIALADGFQVTDEASALEHIGKHPSLITGRADNIKVTHPDDLELCELFLTRNLNSKQPN